MTEVITLGSGGPLVMAGQALTERLQLAFPQARFQHRFLPAKLTQKSWQAFTTKVPAIGLGWTELTPDRDIGRAFNGESHWTVWLVTNNAGGVRQRYFGDALGAGLFQMVQAAVAILHGWTAQTTLDDGTQGIIGATAVVRAGNLYADGWDDDLAIAGVDVTIRLGLAASEVFGMDVPDALTTLGVDWQFGAAAEFPDVIKLEAT